LTNPVTFSFPPLAAFILLNLLFRKSILLLLCKSIKQKLPTRHIASTHCFNKPFARRNPVIPMQQCHLLSIFKQRLFIKQTLA